MDIYYSFLSHNKAWKVGIVTTLFAIIFVFSFIGIRLPGTFTETYALKIESSDSAQLFSGHYEDRVSRTELDRAFIQSDIIR